MWWAPQLSSTGAKSLWSAWLLAEPQQPADFSRQQGISSLQAPEGGKASASYREVGPRSLFVWPGDLRCVSVVRCRMVKDEAMKTQGRQETILSLLPLPLLPGGCCITCGQVTHMMAQRTLWAPLGCEGAQSAPSYWGAMPGYGGLGVTWKQRRHSGNSQFARHELDFFSLICLFFILLCE